MLLFAESSSTTQKDRFGGLSRLSEPWAVYIENGNPAGKK